MFCPERERRTTTFVSTRASGRSNSAETAFGFEGASPSASWSRPTSGGLAHSSFSLFNTVASLADFFVFLFPPAAAASPAAYNCVLDLFLCVLRTSETGVTPVAAVAEADAVAAAVASTFDSALSAAAVAKSPRCPPPGLPSFHCSPFAAVLERVARTSLPTRILAECHFNADHTPRSRSRPTPPRHQTAVS